MAIASAVGLIPLAGERAIAIPVATSVAASAIKSRSERCPQPSADDRPTGSSATAGYLQPKITFSFLNSSILNSSAFSSSVRSD